MTAPFKKYQCHKIVHAAKITAVVERSITFEGEKDKPTIYPFEMFSRYQPKIGDYLVVYEDGYSSFSPAAAFEAGYTLLSDSTESSQ